MWIGTSVDGMGMFFVPNAGKKQMQSAQNAEELKRLQELDGMIYNVKENNMSAETAAVRGGNKNGWNFTGYQRK